MRDGKPFKDHFSAQADDYACRRPGYPAELFDWLASVAPARGAALDVGTGNGQAALGLARHFERVRACDPSARQIAAARPHPRVEYALERAEAIGLPAASIDLLTVAQSAHWFDLALFYREARRVLRPGGVVALWTYSRFMAGPPVDALIEDFYRNVVGPYWPRERRHVEEGYRHLPFPFEPLLPPPLALELRWSLDEVLGYLGTWSAVQRYRDARAGDPLALLATPLRTAWGVRRRTLTWPLHLRVGRRQGS